MASGDEISSEEANELYDWLISRHSRWQETKEDFKKELLGEKRGTEDEIRPRIQKAIDTEKNHDELLQSTISVFDPRGRVCRESGWRILTSEPLVEQNVTNADALIGNLDENWGIIVECKTGQAKPGVALDQLFEAAEEVRANRDYLAEHTGLEIDSLDCVVCVPSELDFRMAEAIEEYERKGLAEECAYIWRLNIFSGETLQIFDNIDTRDGADAVHDHELSAHLSGEGVKVSGDSETTPAFFPSSHLANILEESFSDVLWNREKEGEPVTNFTLEELTDVLTSGDNLLHYSSDSIGERIRDELVPRLLEYGLIKEYEDDDAASFENLDWDEIGIFEYGVDGRTTETILANLSKGFFEKEVDKLAEIEARKRTVKKFQDESGESLDDFHSSS